MKMSPHEVIEHMEENIEILKSKINQSKIHEDEKNYLKSPEFVR